MPQGSCSCAACILGQSAAVVRSSSGRHVCAVFRHQLRRMQTCWPVHRLHAPSTAARTCPSSTTPGPVAAVVASFVVGRLCGQGAGGMARRPGKGRAGYEGASPASKSNVGAPGHAALSIRTSFYTPFLCDAERIGTGTLTDANQERSWRCFDTKCFTAPWRGRRKGPAFGLALCAPLPPPARRGVAIG